MSFHLQRDRYGISPKGGKYDNRIYQLPADTADN